MFVVGRQTKRRSVAHARGHHRHPTDSRGGARGAKQRTRAGEPPRRDGRTSAAAHTAGGKHDGEALAPVVPRGGRKHADGGSFHFTEHRGEGGGIVSLAQQLRAAMLAPSEPLAHSET